MFREIRHLFAATRFAFQRDVIHLVLGETNKRLQQVVDGGSRRVVSLVLELDDLFDRLEDHVALGKVDQIVDKVVVSILDKRQILQRHGPSDLL